VNQPDQPTILSSRRRRRRRRRIVYRNATKKLEKSQ